jgi:hypothetical protein
LIWVRKEKLSSENAEKDIEGSQVRTKGLEHQTPVELHLHLQVTRGVLSLFEVEQMEDLRARKALKFVAS